MKGNSIVGLAAYAAARLTQYVPSSQAQMLKSITNAAAPAGASCDTTPIVLSTPVASLGTWTAISGCAHVSAAAWGAGQNNAGDTGTGARGGGYGAANGVSVTPGNAYGFMIGSGTSGSNDTYFCNNTPGNCTSYSAAAVVTRGTHGNNSGHTNLGAAFTAIGGAGGAKDGVIGVNTGGGGGGGGPNGAGANGGDGTYPGIGGNGGQGDNGTGGAGGAGHNATGPGAIGGNGVEVGGSNGSGGGGGGGSYGGSGGTWGGGRGGRLSSNSKVSTQGGIILTPAP